MLLIVILGFILWSALKCASIADEEIEKMNKIFSN